MGPLFFVLLLIASCKGATPDQIRRGLEALYNSTGGNQVPSLWIHNKNWLSSASYCTWEGITCSAGGDFELNQDASGLKGTIPPEIGLLGDSVLSLELNRNTLYGTLPDQLGGLPRLRKLDIQQNGISGPVPTTFSKLVSLEMFWILGNHMNGTVGLELKPLLDRCASYQPLGCRMGGNPFSCPVPSWVPVQCDMGCINK